ncbi:hypothetical protein BT93_A0454 [Corymbia citriodora subsp. variegata]|nr:hypothetical protein BT93_A0454 [Corymbia citriodora subsp. variegata]
MGTTSELVFISFPALSHLALMVEMARRPVNRNNRLSVTVLIIKFPFNSKIDSNVQSFTASVTTRICFILLPQLNPSLETSAMAFLNQSVESHKADVQGAIANLSARSLPRLKGLIVDMFCTSMIDVAVKFGIPSYVFIPLGVACSDTELDFPCFANPLPATKFLPAEMFMKEDCRIFLGHARKFRETKGILVNTFAELEPRAVEALADLGAPVVYPVGPILNIEVESKKGFEILDWLHQQPDASVVLLFFRRYGSFDEDQTKQIACALDRSGCRFLWSLRRPPAKGKLEAPCDYAGSRGEGFINQTASVGRVIGWAPQVAILAHRAIGVLMSHCGWNSTLESGWFGVPVAAWPQYAEQQFNAFQLVIELSLAMEIRRDYRRDLVKGSDSIVTTDEMEGVIRRLMEREEAKEMRKKVKEASEKRKKALVEGGSRYLSLGRVIEDVCSRQASS